VNALNETSRASGSRWGGLQAYWTAESAEKEKSKPDFRQVELQTKKATILLYLTDELLEDVEALQSYCTDLMEAEISWTIDEALINGTGAGQPLGILNSPAKVAVNKQTGQVANSIVVENVLDMWARLLPGSARNSVWFVNQDALPQLYTMGITIGVAGSPLFQPAGGLSQSPYNTLLGRPVIPCEHCQTLGTEGDLILSDMSQYLLATKGGLQIASSIHVRFIYDESVLRAVFRVDGSPLLAAPITPAKGANDLSAWITLQSRS
jgi:HK97 family phage major capsid protein